MISWRFPSAGKFDGEHYVTPSPNTKHQRVSGSLFGLIWTHLRQHPQGLVFAAPFDVVLSSLDVVEPDLLYLSRERTEVLTDSHIRGAPDVVVEILSPGTRRTDEVTKRKLYERFGVREYWVVDAELDAIKVYRRVGNDFERAAGLTLERGDILSTPLLPELSITLADVFAPAL